MQADGHKRTHTGEKPDACPKFDKRFNDQVGAQEKSYRREALPTHVPSVTRDSALREVP